MKRKGSLKPGFWKRLGASKLMGGIATNKIAVIGSVEAEAVEAALKPTASKTLIETLQISSNLAFFQC